VTAIDQADLHDADAMEGSQFTNRPRASRCACISAGSIGRPIEQLPAKSLLGVGCDLAM
jgi:hypothetical protein